MSKRVVTSRLPKALLAYPFQYILSWVFALAALNLLLGFGAAPTLRAIGAYGFFFYYWVLSSFVGSTLILIGMHKNANTKKVGSLLQAIRLEKLGMILQATATLVFGLIIVYLVGTTAIISCIMYLALTGAYAVKFLVLTRQEKSLVNLAHVTTLEMEVIRLANEEE